MELHKLVQGSPGWLAHRAYGYNGAPFFNASDAPAMMGCSPYKTRSQLLHEMHTGMVPEVDAATQRRFDDGHRFEALARPLAEAIIEDDLYPVVGSLQRLSASFDGLTMCRKVDFEHKSLNDELRAAIPEGDLGVGDSEVGGALPLQYRVQMEQQLLVAGSEKCLFMASKWKGDELVEERHCWYYPDLELRQRIIDGWIQFEKDLAAYVPPVVTVAPVAKAVASLPVVFDMRVQGKLVSCNLEEYKPAALAYIEAINTKLMNDQDFANADSDAKFCRESADKLELAIDQALGQMGDINQALNTVREIAAAFDAKGLALEKLVKSEKDARKLAIVSEAAAELVTHIKALNDRLGAAIMPTIASDFPGVVKGLKSIDSMRDKVATELARCKIEANATADRIGVNLKAIDQAEFQFLFADRNALALRDSEVVTIIIKNRVKMHQAAEARRLEAERTRIAEEERVKAEAAAKIKADAEIAAAAEAQSEANRPAAQKMRPMSDQVWPNTPPFGGYDAKFCPGSNPENPQPEPEIIVLTGDKVDVPLSTQTPPTLKLGTISERFGFNVTAALLSTLGFEPADSKGAAKLYHEANFQPIGLALIEHIESALEAVAA